MLLVCFEQPLARVLAPYWEEIETNYINSSKTVFRKVRGERERIIRYLFSIRQNFVAFLKRPDHKQEFVSDWQKVRPSYVQVARAGGVYSACGTWLEMY